MGFQKGHPKYTDTGDFKKGHKTWNKGLLVLVDATCLCCGKTFKVRKDQVDRGRGKYCSIGCFHASKKGRPAWNKGKTTPQETINKLIASHIGKQPWNKGLKGFMAGSKNPHYGKPLKPRWGKYKEVNMRSGWEIAYAKWLDSKNIEWQYEPRAFDLDNTTYTPDFYLPEHGVYVEIKGWMTELAEDKIKRFQNIYPDIDYMLLEEKELRLLGVLACPQH